MLRSESAASSNIENLTASARAIAEAEALGDTSRRNAALIVSNTEAMNAAVALADQLDENAILAMHAALMRDSDPASAGRWRTEQVWIGGGNFGPRGADYIAPQHSRVPDAITDLLGFTRRPDVPTLPQIAIAHAQFETIHPFTDGNGRTSRALAYFVLCAKIGYRLPGLETIPEQIAANKTPYYDALEAADRHWKDDVLDLGDMEALLDTCLAKQLVSAYEDAQNPDASAVQDRKFH